MDPAPRLTAARAKYPADFELAFNLRPRRAAWSTSGPRTARGSVQPSVTRPRALRPENYAVWVNLGELLGRKGQLDEAIECLKKAIELDPNIAVAHNELGLVLKIKGRLDEATACFRKAIELAPNLAEAHANLGEALKRKGRWDEAIAQYRKARELNPRLVGVHSSLGELQARKGQLDEAIASLREGLELDPKDALVHYNLGLALSQKGQPDEAIASYRIAVELNPKNAEAHTNLGLLLSARGQIDEAIDCYKKAIALDPKRAPFRYNLGLALGSREKFDEAIECYKAAIGLDPQYAEAHCNMASALASQGRFAESLVAIKRGHELGSKRPDWRYPSAEWVQRVEATAAMEAKLPDFLSGQFQPRDNQERVALAEVSATKKLYRTAAGLFAGAFAADSKLAADLEVGHRFYAICNAVMAAAGKGEDAAKLDEEERSRLRHQGLDWLRADLVLWTKLLASGPPASRRAIVEKMNLWKQKPDLASIRDAAVLARLAADEQKAFAQLWADVEALLKKAAENAPVATPSKAAENPTVAMPEKAPNDTEADLLADRSKQAEEHLRAGNPELAVPLLVEVLDGRKARLGPDHTDTLETMNQLGVVYWRLRQFDKSVPLYEELLKLREAKLGRDHVQTVGALTNLGVNYRDAGRLKEAIALLEEAHQRAKKHPGLGWATQALLAAYAKAGENVKLAELLQQQLPEARKALPKDSPQLAGMLAEVGQSLVQQKKWTEAEPLLRECLGIREKAQPDAWATFNTRSRLGGALLGQKKYAEAEPLLRNGYDGMKQRETTIPPQAAARLPEALDRLIDFYTATNKPDEAKKWQAERAKYPAIAPLPGQK